MKYIDEKFKDDTPQNTVDKIISILESVGIKLQEKWNDSEIENCCSLLLAADGGIPSANGKGITKELARASAYGEFMERLQSGLFFYKYQSLENDPSVNLQTFAPDKKYITADELLNDESGWIDEIAKTYNISRADVVNQCKMYACSDRILVLPFYSLFEDKYVYLPASFVEHMYSANGCCVGNTKYEAWVHALSEILERHNNIEIIKNGKNAPVIPRKELEKFKTVNKILKRIDQDGTYDVTVMDYSCGIDFPVIATQIINKKTKEYLVNVGADPVLEIAVERTLTEIFQGRSLSEFFVSNRCRILSDKNEIRLSDNIINQLETGNGLYTADFFVNKSESKLQFTDNSNKSNKELLLYVLDIFKSMGKQIYVRNYSFLGLDCYKFVIPGFSESRGERLKDKIPQYYYGDIASKALRNIKKANIIELSQLIMHYGLSHDIVSRAGNYCYLSGLPMLENKWYMIFVHMAYAGLKTGNKKTFSNIDYAISVSDDEKEKDYLKAVKQWVMLKDYGLSKEDALSVLKKFCFADTFDKISKDIENNTLLEDLLVECLGPDNCDNCKHNSYCKYREVKCIIKKAGDVYSQFVDGQNRENFKY